MRWHIFAIGKPKLGYARAGIEEYAARLKPFVPVTIEYLKAAASPVVESQCLLERSRTMHRIVLDERGEHLRSTDLATKLAGWEMHGPRDFALLVGGAEGHAPELRQAAGWRWSLSQLTLQHELALVVALEQLYRAYTIKAGMPYHRE
jgi:23S rRNA (pseudouridine1915-N3)-methyltransferase